MPSHFPTRRPLSITGIGIYMLFGACLMPVNILAHAPAFLLGTDFRGWNATLLFTAMGALDAVIGMALLWLAPWSRIAAIYFLIFRMANMFVTFSFPGSRARFEQGVDAMRVALGQHSARRSPVWFGPIFELALMGAVLCILLTSKQAFLVPGDGTTTASAPPTEQDI